MILLCLVAFMDNRRRRCPPVVTLHNYTGNFVLTPAVSMDANRSASSLLPQLVQLLLSPTLQALQVVPRKRIQWKVDSVCNTTLQLFVLVFHEERIKETALWHVA